MDRRLMDHLREVDRAASPVLTDREWHSAMVVAVYHWNYEHQANYPPREAIAAYLGLKPTGGRS